MWSPRTVWNYWAYSLSFSSKSLHHIWRFSSSIFIYWYLVFKWVVVSWHVRLGTRISVPSMATRWHSPLSNIPGQFEASHPPLSGKCKPVFTILHLSPWRAVWNLKGRGRTRTARNIRGITRRCGLAGPKHYGGSIKWVCTRIRQHVSVIMTPHHGVSSHQQLDCLFNCLFTLTTKKVSKFRRSLLPKCYHHIPWLRNARKYKYIYIYIFWEKLITTMIN